MNLKILEIRDRGTFIGVLAIEMIARRLEGTAGRPDEIEQYYLRRAGYGENPPCIVLLRLECDGHKIQAACDPYEWGCDSPRTMHAAHLWICDHWDELNQGDVVDVEVVLGEKTTPKQSERLSDAIQRFAHGEK